MIYITRAIKSDLPAIQDLMLKYGNKCIVESYHLNKKDIALQARLETGELVGFVYCGLLAEGKVAYMDKVTIDPMHHKKGILISLYSELFKRAYRRGVKEVTGFIRHDEYHNASCVQALKMGLGADALSYTYVRAQLEFMKKETGIEV